MYVGRLLVVGPSVAAYRVSSRSFPNRAVADRGGVLTVGPTAEAEETDNPYVSYNCVRFVGDGPAPADPAGARAAVLGNGSHVDPVAEKVGRGYPARDALAEALLALDYEKDDYDTPRIAGVVERTGGGVEGAGDSGATAHVGVVRRDALLVEAVAEPTLVATYERDAPEAFAFGAETAAGAARAAYDLDFEHPVCAAGVAVADGGFESAVVNGD